MRRGVLLAVLVTACGGGDAASLASGSMTVPAAGAQAALPANSPRRTIITDAVQKISPAVVTVQTEMVERVPVDPFERFFGGRSGERSSAGIGSGFITRADGVIVTNAHVVAGATKVSVALRDGQTYTAKILGADEANDLAVLKIDARNLPTAKLGTSDDLLVGEWVIAIGNPYGFLLGNTEPSVTTGVVSGVGRNLVGQGQGGGVYVDMIQTDAAINPGNSGGPLVNATGDVIGVNSSIYSPTGSSIGLGFAIPINRAKRVTEDLLVHGQVRRPWVGIKPALAISPDGSRMQLTRGVTVQTVVPGSPAAQAGIRAGDVIVKSRARTLRNPYDWDAELLELRAGEKLTVVVRRDGRDTPLTLTVADLPEISAPKVQVLRELELVSLTPAIRTERNIRSARGAVVYKVSDRVSEELGLQPGDVIVQINQVRIEDAATVEKVISSQGGRGALRLYFERGGQVFSSDFMVR
ncbi:MAG: trypsin-like peptidase domain-containing protein [Gemmatimonadetes bacterium]|nr:trypsin-like peptidase domain-containing protein [Gemmatimonadota bacterium]